MSSKEAWGAVSIPVDPERLSVGRGQGSVQVIFMDLT